jgi:hypothetical protein
MKSLFAILLVLANSTSTIQAQMNRSLIDFEYQGFKLNGVLNTQEGEAKGLVK